MGVNNKARRAAKKRRRGTGRDGRTGEALFQAFRPHDQEADERELAATLIYQTVRGCAHDPRTAGEQASLLVGPGSPTRPPLVAEAMHHLLSTLLVTVVRGGWSPSDLAEIVRRRLTPDHLPALAAALTAEADRYAADRVSAAWREELTRLGPASKPDLETPTGLGCALGLAALLTTLPSITELTPPPGRRAAGPGRSAGHGDHADARQLARVRALLAKAESTEFTEEAEALSAKAQELISRYALERLVDEAEHGQAAQTPVSARRVWIDAPYLLPKALLIDAVAGANRCRSVVSEHLGFSTVIGERRDLDAVELLSTSLLVQANTAMLREGRHTDRRGSTRTTSFRRAFLLAYATRIGERLTAASDHAAESCRPGELVPLLQHRAERVTAVFEELFPRTAPRETTMSNGHGWAAGRAAADLALLDSNLPVNKAAG